MPYSATSIHGSQPTYRCSECNRGFKNVLLGYLHHQEHFSRVFCSECKVFLHKNDWRRHRQLFHAEAKYECRFCPAAFTSMQALKKHVHERHTGPWIKCKKCGKILKTTYGLQRHVCASEKVDESAGEIAPGTALPPLPSGPSS